MSKSSISWQMKANIGPLAGPTTSSLRPALDQEATLPSTSSVQDYLRSLSPAGVASPHPPFEGCADDDSAFAAMSAHQRIPSSSLLRRGSDASYLQAQGRHITAHPYAPPGHAPGTRRNSLCSPLMGAPFDLHEDSARPLPIRKKSLVPNPRVDSKGEKIHFCEFEGCDRAFKRLEHRKRHERYVQSLACIRPIRLTRMLVPDHTRRRSRSIATSPAVGALSLAATI